MASKKSTVLTHAKHRFWTRYDIRLTDQVYQQIVKDIQQQRTRVILPQGCGGAVVHDVVVNGIHIPVVYKNKQIVTALPDCCLKAENIGLYINIE